MTLDRRTFLKGGSAAAAGIAWAGPFQGFLARAAGAAGPSITLRRHRRGPSGRRTPARSAARLPTARSTPTRPPCPTAPRCPAITTAWRLPGRWPRVLLIRNHERNGSLALSRAAPVYDSAAPGGVTYVLVDLEGNRERTWPALAGTQARRRRHDSVGHMDQL